MKKSLLLIAGILAGFFAFAELKYSQTIDGNTHILARKDLEALNSEVSLKYTADSLYKEYDDLRKACGKNDLLFDQKREGEFAGRPVRLSGYVKKVKKTFFDEYIIELSTSKLLSWNISVVYPKRMADDEIKKITSYKEGDFFEALVFTRSTYLYVDVPVWNQNGVYKTVQ